MRLGVGVRDAHQQQEPAADLSGGAAVDPDFGA
jgi:hypothetical protein